MGLGLLFGVGWCVGLVLFRWLLCGVCCLRFDLMVLVFCVLGLGAGRCFYGLHLGWCVIAVCCLCCLYVSCLVWASLFGLVCRGF